MLKIIFFIFVFHGITFSQTAPAEGYFVKEKFISKVISSVIDSLNRELDEDLGVYPSFILHKTDRDCLPEPLGIVKRLVTYRPAFISEDEVIVEYSGCRINKDILTGVVFSLPIINSYQNVLFLNVEYNGSRSCFEFPIPLDMITKVVIHVQTRMMPDTTSVLTERELFVLDSLGLSKRKLGIKKKEM